MNEKLKCPKCGTTMEKIEIERDNVTIDKCPNCWGIWLDKGELDKVLHKDKKFAHIRLNWPG